MVFTQWSPNELLSFFMVLIRVSTLIILLPIFGDKSVPQTVKVFLSLTVSAVLFPILKQNGVIHILDAEVWSETTAKLLLTLAGELMVGLAIGFSSQLVFHSIQAGGDFMAQFMGMSMASQYDPHTESQTVILGQFLNGLAILTFLSLDGHHLLFKALVESFHFIPQGHFVINDGFKNSLISMTGNTIFFGVQLAAPMAAIMLLVNIVYGIFGKALPQLNILTLSMASGVFVGLLVLIVTYPSIQNGMANLFQAYFEDLKQFMIAYGGK